MVYGTQLNLQRLVGKTVQYRLHDPENPDVLFEGEVTKAWHPFASIENIRKVNPQTEPVPVTRLRVFSRAQLLELKVKE